jgi:rod shape-determining protein MreC
VVVYRHDRRRRLTLVLLIVTSLALITLDERGSGIINSARTAAQDVVSPLQTLADDVINPVSDWLDGLGRANELQDENDQLRRQLADARSEVAAAKASLAERNQLRQILDLPTIDDSTAVTAEVVSQGTDNFTRTFQIAKGSGSGIVKGMPVVVGDTKGGAALVGQVVSVSKSRAIVRRIDDRNFGVGAQLVQGSGAGPRGTASGQANSGLLTFSVIVDSATGTAMKKGDVAVTLGGDTDLFPQNLVIGTVVHEVGAGGAIARDAELRPIVDLDALTLVKVLKYLPGPVP